MAATRQTTCEDAYEKIAIKVQELAAEKYPQYSKALFGAYVPDAKEEVFMKIFQDAYGQEFRKKDECTIDESKTEQAAKEWLTVAVNRKAPCVLQENADYMGRKRQVDEAYRQIDAVKYGPISDLFSLQKDENGKTSVDVFFDELNDKIEQFKNSFERSYHYDQDALKDADARIAGVIKSLEDIKEKIEQALETEYEADLEDLQEEISEQVEDSQELLDALDKPTRYDMRDSQDYEESL